MSRLADRALGLVFQGLQRLTPPSSDANPWLEGNYAPVTEEVEEIRLTVTGTIPAELNGLYARIGPNPVTPPNPGRYHWFAGDGMVHGVRLREGKALWYRRRWVRTEPVSRALGEPVVPGPRRGSFDVVNTNIIGHAGKLWALVEAGPYPVELDGELNTVASNNFHGTLDTCYSAHPHIDPADGSLHAVCYNGPDLNRLFYIAVGADGRVRRRVDIPVRHGPMVHDCAITSRYVIIFDLPVTFSPRRLLSSAMPYAWNPNHDARIGLLPRDGRAEDIIWCAVDPCYVFHSCNAYDLPDGRVQLDVVTHDRMFADSTVGPDSQHVAFERWLLDPKRGTTARTVASDQRQEFPRYDERLATQYYRYAYAVSFAGHSGPSRLFKHDLSTGRTEVHEHGLGRETGEAVFVPRSPDAAEDDGWLISIVYDADQGTSDLVIVNAQDISGPPQAIVHLHHRVPHGFHGNWIAD